MPVLIILLYYISDLSKLKRYYDQTEFVAQQVVNMIQNISKKGESKAITLTDLSYIHCTAWLSVYPGTTMYQKNNQGYEFAHMPRMVIFYVKGVGNGKVSCLWRAYIAMKTTNTPNSVYVGSAKNQNDAEAWITQYKTDAIPSEINPQLSEIKEGDTKIIVEVAIGRRDGKNSFGKVVTLKDSLGLYLATPKTRAWTGNEQTSIFNSCAIFKPNQHLFTDDPPKKQ